MCEKTNSSAFLSKPPVAPGGPPPHPGRRKEPSMFRGSIPPLPTPFRRGRLDEEALRRLVERVVQGAPTA